MTIPGVTFLAPDLGPCIVCGHATGDCTSEDHDIVFNKETDENTFLVEEDVIERKWVTKTHLAKILVVAAGTHISRSEAQKLGLI